MADGQVDIDASIARLAETRNTRGGKRTKGQQGTVQTTDEGEGQQESLTLAGGTLTDARTAQARNRAKLDALEYEERIGKLIERSSRDRAIADGLGPILSRLDGLPARAAPKIVGQTDVRRVIDALEDEVINLRQEIADTLRAMIAASGATKQ